MGISIIIKTLNEEARIAAAIESALAALPGEGEVIVADSGSSDRTVEIARRYPVRIAQIVPPARASCGIGPQLGFQYARQELVCLIDGDMLLDADFLAAAAAHLAANPRCAGVTGHVAEEEVRNLEFISRVARYSPEKRTGEIDRMNGGGLYRRAALEDVGYFSDRNLHSFEEFDLGVRLRAHGWTLFRLDRRFVSHYGHTVNSYRLLLRRWRSGYIFGMGELLRAAMGKPYWRRLVRELPDIKLWAAVYLWWLAMLVLVVALPDKPLALALDLLSVAGLVALMSWRRKSLSLGLYAVVAWHFHAAALPVGFFRPRQAPSAWIESRLIEGAAARAAGRAAQPAEP
ncbi:MAG TPA: glycosyltransferase [Devosiaceae bacterium]|jgi:glycosyltransferase involved in cell wall biosynthesis|nr:glycosyltransferase [Devosiaceae bacterium]